MWLGTNVVLDWIPEWFLCCQTRKPYPARHDRRHRCSFTVEFDQVIKLFFCCEQNSCCFSPVFKIASCENFDHLFVLLRRPLLCLQHFFLKPHCPMSYAKCVLKLLNLGPNCGKGMSRCVGMPWNAFLAYSTHEKVVKLLPLIHCPFLLLYVLQ